MEGDAPREDASGTFREALEDFARLALLVSEAQGVRIEAGGTTIEAGAVFAPSSFEIPLEGVGRVILFGASKQEEFDPLARLIVADANGRRAQKRRDEEHEAALATAARANEIAQSAARRFEALFEGLPIACYACDVAGRLMEWNAAAEEIWPALAMAWGAEAAPLIDPESPDAEATILRRALAGETVRSEERELRTGESESRWHLVSAFPLRDGTQGIVGALCARLDITRRRLAQRELVRRETRFRTVLETLGEGITVIDEAGEVVLRNPSAERILRLAPSETNLGTAFPEGSVVDAEARPLPIEEWPVSVALRTGRPARDVRLGVSRPDSPERIWISVNAEPLPGPDGPLGAVATFHDLTEQMRQEARLAAYAARLEEERS